MYIWMHIKVFYFQIHVYCTLDRRNKIGKYGRVCKLSAQIFFFKNTFHFLYWVVLNCNDMPQKFLKILLTCPYFSRQLHITEKDDYCAEYVHTYNVHANVHIVYFSFVSILIVYICISSLFQQMYYTYIL